MTRKKFKSPPNIFTYMIFICLFSYCGEKEKENTIELITDTAAQDSIFRQLVLLTDHAIDTGKAADSLAFLILPVHASCPYCRNKVIDSIVKYQHTLPQNHYIIIAAKGGRKTINSYFRERKKELPVIEHGLFLDSTNLSYRYNLYDDKPTMYYSYGYKVYKKVASIPVTIKDDLHQFFSGSGQ
jgi:hypothetical protein